MARRLLLGVLMASGLVPALARADSIENRQRIARTSCLSGDYARGVALLAELFVDTRDPTHIYNQGRCFEQNQRFQEAIGRFQEYLRVGRNMAAEEVTEVKKHIADCRQLLNEQKGSESAPREAPPVPPPAPLPAPSPVTPAVTEPAPSPPSLGEATTEPSAAAAQPAEPTRAPGRALRIAGIVTGATGAASIVAGILLSLKSRQLTDDIEKLDGYTPSRESSRKLYRNLGYAAYGVGGACLATGAVLTILGFRQAATENHGVAFSPLVAPQALGASIAGVF